MRITINLIVFLLTIIADSLISSAPTSNDNDDCVCGIGQQEIKPRIKNGHKVKGHKYPWMVQIKSFLDRDEGDYFQCGGSLIDHRHIITAAHCFEKEDGSFFTSDDVDIYLGRNKFVDFDVDSFYQVDRLWIDPNYESDLLANDFAIVTLKEVVGFDEHISPICLPDLVNGVDGPFTIAGWGVTGPGKNDDSSDKLLESSVDLVQRDECEQLLLNWLKKTNSDELKSPDFNVTQLIAQTHLCARNIVTGGDTCSGDSGGPLMYRGQDDRWFLIGIVSGSWTECGVDENGASLYTKLNSFKETIKSQVPNACWHNP